MGAPGGFYAGTIERLAAKRAREVDAWRARGLEEGRGGRPLAVGQARAAMRGCPGARSAFTVGWRVGREERLRALDASFNERQLRNLHAWERAGFTGAFVRRSLEEGRAAAEARGGQSAAVAYELGWRRGRARHSR